jgi:hypothetical protein
MFFKSGFLYNRFHSIAALFKKCFGSVGSVILLFLPIIYFAWKIYRKHISKINIPNITKPIPNYSQKSTEPPTPDLLDDTTANYTKKIPKLFTALTMCYPKRFF